MDSLSSDADSVQEWTRDVSLYLFVRYKPVLYIKLPISPTLLLLTVCKSNVKYPISTLPEHLHSTSLSYAETTLNSRKLVSFPLIAHYLSAGPPLPPTPPFTGRPGNTHTYPSFSFSAPRKPHVLLAAVTRYVCFALKALKLPVFSFELTLLTFSVSSLWIISYIYIYIYTYVVRFTYFL